MTSSHLCRCSKTMCKILVWSRSSSLFWILQGFCRLNVSRERMLDWRWAVLFDHDPARFCSGECVRGTGACWRTSHGTPVQLQLKMSQRNVEIGLGAQRWWWEEAGGGAAKWKVKDRGYESHLKLMGQGGAGLLLMTFTPPSGIH